MIISIEFHDNVGEVHGNYEHPIPSPCSLEELRKDISSTWGIDKEYCQLFTENGVELVGPGETSIQFFGLEYGSKVILKHSLLPQWDEYKKCADLVLVEQVNIVANAKRAVKIQILLRENRFFTVYESFVTTWRANYCILVYFADDGVIMMKNATENYFRNLHDQGRGNEESEFICYFERRPSEFAGWSTSTLAFARIHGENSVTKYNVKCHYHDVEGIKTYRDPDITELYCYKLLSLIGVCPKSHIIPPSMSAGVRTSSTYIATVWDDKFDNLKYVADKNNLCADVVAQLVMLEALLFIYPICENNYGRWKATNNAAIVSLARTDNCYTYSDIKEQMQLIVRHWKEKNGDVRIQQLDDNYMFKLAKIYLDKWNLESKIELAREQLDPTGTLLKCFELSPQKNHLNKYINTLYKNVENLRTVLNSTNYS